MDQPQIGRILGNALARERQELLEHGLRNPLISFKYPKTRSVRFLYCHGADLFRALIDEETTFQLVPGGGSEEQDAANAIDTLAAEGTALWTALSPDRQRAVLKAMARDAKSAIEEQGVNLLFMAIGVLRWYESNASDDEKVAPLLLVPVALEPKGGDRYLLKPTGEDVELNLSMISKLAAEFDVRVPGVDDLEALSPESYFSEVERIIEPLPRWRVDADEVVLGFFSFTKYLMYKDLDPAAWPSGAGPLDHPILKGLLGDRVEEQPPLLSDDEFLDDRLAPGAIPTVLDADSSQLAAIADVQAGRTLIIQGPPGTGKSQTITNIIADAIARQQTVLFVSEKLAALDVVKRRLDAVGLGGACLELHGSKTNKRQVVAELQRTLDLGRPKERDVEGHLEELQDKQDRLNAFSRAMNTEVAASALTPFQAVGQIVRHRQRARGTSLPRFRGIPMGSWTAAEHRAALKDVRDLAERLEAVGDLSTHPFRGTRRRTVLLSEQEDLRNALEAALAAGQRLAEVSQALSQDLGVDRPADRLAAERMADLADRLQQAPDLTGAVIRHPGWHRDGATLLEVVQAGNRWHRARTEFGMALRPEAWNQDLDAARRTLAAYDGKVWRLLVREFRQAVAVVGALCVAPAGPHARLLQLADAIVESRRCEQVVLAHEDLALGCFGESWAGLQTDWTRMAVVAPWLRTLHGDLAAGRLPASALTYLEANPASGRGGSAFELRRLLGEHASIMKRVTELIDLDEAQRFGDGGILGLTFEAQLRLVETWLQCHQELKPLILLEARKDDLRKRGLGAVVDALAGWAEASVYLEAAFEVAYHQAVLERAFEERPPLREFESASHNSIRSRFQELDQELGRLNRSRIALGHWSRLPSTRLVSGEVQVLKREFEKRSRHMPIRKLLVKAGTVIQQGLKPVFMMSPLSIATFLPPGVIRFDLVVFDEASQIRPVDAFGAIVRGAQLVVVGDDRQLPPTDFFQRTFLADGPADDEDEEDRVDAESILGLCKAHNVPDRMLRWHYRSRHESLIAGSNRLFYENKLVVFPSPDQRTDAAGLIYRRIPESVYDRGGSRTNLGEARYIAAAVMAHARQTPELSLGVAAFSVAQRDAIQDELEVLQRQAGAVPFFSEHPREPFFVKNLENIQGDERDVILISVGYGKDAAGYLAMSFGPVNRDNGGPISEGGRRLNVLFTRARLRCEIVTNLQPEDLDLQRTKARGVADLRAFLTYARDGFLDVPELTGREADSPFEEAVMAALVARGHQVEAQVGCAGFRIDMAVRDPRQPGRFLLGIECDGAAYHSSRSARDRDRLRQQVLEGLNWRIHRIWSTDWFQNEQAQIAKVEEAIAMALSDVPTYPEPAREPEADFAGPADLPPAAVQRSGLPPYCLASLAIDLAGREFHQLPARHVAKWVRDVVLIESPVHESEVRRRVTAAAGLKRIGSRVDEALEAGIALATKDGLHRSDGFLWADRSQAVAPRDRSGLPAASRKTELVAPEELAAAVKLVVRAGYSVDAAAAPVEVARLLGFGRTSDDLARRIQQEIERLCEFGELLFRDGRLVVG